MAEAVHAVAGQLVAGLERAGQNAMTLWPLRIGFLFICMLGSWSISQLHEVWARHPVMAVVLGLLGGIVVIIVDEALKGFSLRGLSAATFGLFIGFMVSYFVGNSVLFQFIEGEMRLIGQIVMYVVCTYLAMVIALRGKDEFNMVIPYVKFMRENKPERLVLLDTNVIIDGRILEVSATGFLDAIFVVPRFVLNELHYIADAADDIKRACGRRGLEMLNALQNNPHVEVKIHENDVPEIREVDGKLVHLAKVLRAEILTNDYNLNRIAELQNVRVLNLHDLAKALRPPLTPGQRLQLKPVKEGKEHDQAVAYLDDGTMVVINNGRRFIGHHIEATISSLLQTTAGRLVFAELAPSTSANPPANSVRDPGALAVSRR
jgi:uncharacterized protein YacL